MTYRMNARLREELLDGVAGEGWGDDDKGKLMRTVAELGDGDLIPVPGSAEEYEAIFEVLDEFYPVLSLIEYFGLENVT